MTFTITPCLTATFVALTMILTSQLSFAEFNRSSCLSIDTTNTTSDAAYLVNGCSNPLKVTYCFGTYACDNPNGIRATDVPALGKRTIYYGDAKGKSLISYAVPQDTPHDEYMVGVKAYFNGRNPDGPRF